MKRFDFKWLLLGLVLLGTALRFGRLAWQPLWADEGYSVYFATEPVARMFWLTANDIHPPLYYALLHLWQFIVNTTAPAALRLFSAFVSLPALLILALLARLLFPHRPRAWLIATLLLVVNPLHLFYSQEIRMYGLAMSLTLASTFAYWKTLLGWLSTQENTLLIHDLHGQESSIVSQTESTQRKGLALWRWLYILLATSALYTLYYCAFLLFAHFIFAIWQVRKEWKRLRTVFSTYLIIALLYLPWLLYTATALTAYVDDKIASDQDRPLGLLFYLGRHIIAALAGHLPWSASAVDWRWMTLFAVVFAVIGALGTQVAERNRLAQKGVVWQSIVYPFGHRPQQALLLFLLLPVTIAFLINLRFPFFPEGGERLLLFLLPYWLLMLAHSIDRSWRWWHSGKIALLLLLVIAGCGGAVFFTTPRHQADDYHPLIHQVVQQGNNDDTFLVTFPWQVGLWRAYAPGAGLPAGGDLGPQVILASERSVVWGEPLRQLIEDRLVLGTLWFPGLRSIGSTLPADIDRYFAAQPAIERPVLLVDAWYGNTTLRAWHRLDAPKLEPRNNSWSDLQLVAAGVAPTIVAAANTALRIDLQWQQPLTTTTAISLSADSPSTVSPSTVSPSTVSPSTVSPTTVSPAGLSVAGMTLRLRGNEHLWANQDVVGLTDVAGLIVPVGLPPGEYTLELGLIDQLGELLPVLTADGYEMLVTLRTLQIDTPAEPMLAARLPMQKRLAQPVTVEGLRLLGYTMPEEVPLAGETMAVTLFGQNEVETMPLRHLYLSLLDESGTGLGGWEGWPLPNYPTTALASGALVQIPVEFALPPTLATGSYQVGVGLLDPESGVKSTMVLLGEQSIKQRAINYAPVTPPNALTPPIQFGTHAQLIGYKIQRTEGQLTIQLYWHVLQPLLPPHHIFIHLADGSDQLIAQSDDLPHTADGRAPTGSWLPNEYLVTTHQIDAPFLAADGTTPQAYHLNIGLYVPATGVRLPTMQGDTVSGDHLSLPLQP